MREASDTMKDYDIVVAMRRGEAVAFERYIERFHRILLDYARRSGVPASERDELVSELLDDVAIQLMTRSAPLPQNPRMYLLSALRHKLLNRKRGSERRRRVVSEAARAAYAGWRARWRIGRRLLRGDAAREPRPRVGRRAAAARARAARRPAERGAAATTSGSSSSPWPRTFRSARSPSGSACRTP